MQKNWIINKVNDTKAEVLLYGYIFDSVASDFVKELRSLEKDYSEIDVRINSGGGDVFDGFAIFNAMQQSKANINTYNDGLAGSMASIVLQGGKKRYMSKVARVMTHKPSTFAGGDSGVLRKNADLLDSMEDLMAAVYASRTGKTKEDVKIKFLNGNDNWFDAQQAIEAGLVDEVYDAAPVQLPAAAMNDEKKTWDGYSQLKFAAQFIQKNKNDNMKQFTLSPAICAALDITATEEAIELTVVEAAVAGLQAKAAEADVLRTQLTAVTGEKDNAVNELNTLKKTMTAEKINAICDAAIGAKKMTVQMAAQLKADYEGKPDELKKLVDNMPATGSVVEAITTAGSAELADLAKMSGEEIYKADKFERLKALDISTFKAKYKEYFATDYTEK